MHPDLNRRVHTQGLTNGPGVQRDPTRQPNQNRGDHRRRELADGEVFGPVKVTGVLPTLVRTQRCSWHGQKSTGSRLLPCMAERRCGSSSVRRPRPWHGERRCSGYSATQCGARARGRKAIEETERGCPRGAKLRRGGAHSGEEFLAGEDLPLRTDASTGCSRWRRCSGQDGASPGELERSEQPTLAMARGGASVVQLLLALVEERAKWRGECGARVRLAEP